MRILHSVILLVLSIAGANAYVFSCLEIKPLVTTNVEVSTRFACLVPKDNFYVQSYLLNIFVRADNVSTSFAALIKQQCVENTGDGPWTIWSTNTLNPIACDNDLALIFTSTRPAISVISLNYEDMVVNTTALSPGDERVFVNAPRGMTLRPRQCTGHGYVNVLTGAGSGEPEERFLLKSWRCADLPDAIISFNNVITVAVDGDVQLTLDYTRSPTATADEWQSTHEVPVSLDSRIAVMASARSDRLLYGSGINYVKFTAGLALTVTAACSPCSLDEEHGGLIQLVEYEPRTTSFTNEHGALVSEELFRTEGAYNLTIEKLLQIEYKSDYSKGENQDYFVVELSFSEAPTPPTAAAITETDPYCGCGLDEQSGMPDGWNSTDIWLDIFIILDTSEAMGEQNLEKAASLIESLFGDGNNIMLTTNTSETFYTRVGVIAMAEDPTTLYNLNMTKGDKVSGKVQITKGLAAIDYNDAYRYASFALSQNRDYYRLPARQVIYYMTASERTGDADPFSFKPMQNGIIMINDFNAIGDRRALQKLASPGFYQSKDNDAMASIQQLCKANCFCNSKYAAYAGPGADQAMPNLPSGGCFNAQTIGGLTGQSLPFVRAQEMCKSPDNGWVAGVHGPVKAQYLLELIYAVDSRAFSFWIGYTRSADGIWQWKDNSTAPYTNWDVDEPSQAAVATCAWVDVDQGLYWGAGNCNLALPSVCEYAPCSVGHKC